MCRVRSTHISDPLPRSNFPSLVRWLLVLVFLGLSLSVLPTPLALALTMTLALTLALTPNTDYIVWHTGRRDAQLAYRYLHLLWSGKLAEWRNSSVGEVFLRTAASFPSKVMVTLCTEEGEEKMTFLEVEQFSCRLANYFLQQGFMKGDVVALVSGNRVDYCCYWLGLSMLGCTTALVNCHLRQAALLHTLTVARARAVLYSPDLAAAVAEISPSLPSTTTIISLQVLQQLARPYSPSPPPKMANFTDDLLYIYTSGTTGLPKAAVVKHSRFHFAAAALPCIGGVSSSSVLYSALPLYHTAAGVMSLGAAIYTGATLVTRRKFSARAFWSDCCREGVTAAQYIGEIARYLSNSPECPEERQHSVRMMYGNGLRADIWPGFVERFGVEQIVEFYGATEGNCSVVNLSNKVGAVGFISQLLPWILPLGLVRVEEGSLEVLRNPSTGLAVPCRPGEAGELVGKIVAGHPVRDFLGYADKQASAKKVLRDVYRAGDLYFRSGDLLVMDSLGWLYFRDRAGDTFRWKGENVSTLEVEAAVTGLLARDCVVYGVELPGTDGRAGMAAVTDPGRDLLAGNILGELYSGLEARLPSYAMPVFLRLVDNIEVTATHKMKKTGLQEEGFDPALTGDDPVLMLDTNQHKFRLMKLQDYDRVMNGNWL